MKYKSGEKVMVGDTIQYMDNTGNEYIVISIQPISFTIDGFGGNYHPSYFILLNRKEKVAMAVNNVVLKGDYVPEPKAGQIFCNISNNELFILTNFDNNDKWLAVSLSNGLVWCSWLWSSKNNTASEAVYGLTNIGFCDIAAYRK